MGPQDCQKCDRKGQQIAPSNLRLDDWTESCGVKSIEVGRAGCEGDLFLIKSKCWRFGKDLNRLVHPQKSNQARDAIESIILYR